MRLLLRDLKCDEGLLAYKLNFTFVSSSTYEPPLAYLRSFIPNLFVNDPTPFTSSEDDSAHENPHMFVYLPPIKSIEHEPTPKPQLPI